MKIVFLACMAGLLALLSACTTAESEAVQAVNTYLEALAAKDADRLVSASCADWESSARLEMDSFAAVTPELVEVLCQESEMDGEATLVACTGQIKLDYNGEIMDLELSGQLFRTVQEGGEWRMCGYQ
jgi:hypothetical protein